MKLSIILALFLFPSILIGAEVFTVTTVTGSVVYRAPGVLKKTTVKLGSTLAPGGRIKMKDGAYLALSTPMKDEITLTGKTYLRLDSLEKSATKTKCSLEIFNGTVFSKVNKLKPNSTYTVKTPVAVAGVRGTEFECRVEETGETEIEVSEGEVEIQDPESSAPPVSVTAGKSAKVSTAGAVKVTAIPASKQKAKAVKAQAAKASAVKASKAAKQQSTAAPTAKAEEKAETETKETVSPNETTETETPNEIEADEPEAEQEEPDLSEATAAAAAEASEEATAEAVEEAVAEAIDETVDEVIEEAIDEAIDQVEIDDVTEEALNEAIEEATDEANVDLEFELESINR